MNIFKSVVWKWWELGMVKWSSAFCALALGAYFHEFFEPHAAFLLFAGLFLGAWVGYRWWKKPAV